MKKNFLFSVIITIYDAEEYIAEAIESIVNQTIGFEENIQLILVNNASIDGCEKICLEYKERYKENIKYIKLPINRGPAGGRNAGIPYIKGEFFNYLDADDLWGENAFEEAYNFLLYRDDVDILSCRRKHFGRWNGYHHTDYKFKNVDRIIDIFNEYDAIQLHVTSCFFRTKKCCKHRFNEKIGIGEDSEYVTSLILQHGKYGALNNNIFYYYRKREDGQSALDGKEKKKSYFLNDYIRIIDSISKKSTELYGKIIPFAQFQIAYETGWLLRGSCSILNNDELKELKQNVHKYINKLDDEIILNSTVMRREHRAYALNIKYGDNYVSTLELNELSNIKLFEPINKKNVSLKTIDIEESKLILTCSTSIFPAKERWSIYLKDILTGRKYFPTESFEAKRVKSLEENIFIMNGHKWDINLQGINYMRLKFVLFIDGQEYFTNFKTGDWVKVTPENRKSYYCKKADGKCYSFKINHKNIIISSLKSKFKLEASYLQDLMRIRKYKAVYYRVISLIAKPFFKKKILLISDRINTADDNGELFYKWILKSNVKKKVKAYYVLDKKSTDVSRIKKYGKVLYFNSLKYKLLYANAHAIISSMVDEYIFHVPFVGVNKYMLDLDKPRVCLGHGVSEQDMSRNEGKFALNLRMYSVASYGEYRAKMNNAYGYSEREIKLTGTPRQDYIYNLRGQKKEKGILFAPTWRKSLAGKYRQGLRDYNPQFKESEYFIFYNKLINDERILNVMREYGYTGVFNIHPAIKENIIDFQGNDLIKVQKRNESYMEQFAKNRLVITDYSSIAHDYAYAGSSVIYTQFDEDTFYKNHTYSKGTFDYVKDGFGPVCYDYESTIIEIIKAIKSDCKVNDIYTARCKNYFSFFDNKNCERIYDAIMEL